MKDNIVFIYIVDNRFYSLLEKNINQTRFFYPEAKILVYDLSKDSSLEIFINNYNNVFYKKWNIEYENISWFEKKDINSQNINRELIFCQKPLCLLDAVKNTKENRVVYLDTDAFLINRIDDVFENNFDVAVTLRRKNEICFEFNNCTAINAGVIMFNCAEEKKEAFLKEWIKKMSRIKENLVEQTALTRFISEKLGKDIFDYYKTGVLDLDGGFRVSLLVLPCEIYNYNWIEEGIDYNKIKIVHFKSGRYVGKERKMEKILKKEEIFMLNTNKEIIIEICKKNAKKFEEIISFDDFKFEPKGVFNSELLLIYSMVIENDIDVVLESGRARGQSTYILAKVFENFNVHIKSIELEKYTEDTIVAMRRLRKFKNLELYYGDSFKVINRLIPKATTVVLIDGPKSYDALKLACQVLKYRQVKVVFIHDVHKDSDTRAFIEEFFPNSFFTDDKDYVSSFEYLDTKCWQQQRLWEEAKDWYPYRRGEKVMQSYSSTLGMIINKGEETFLAAEKLLGKIEKEKENLYGFYKIPKIKRYYWKLKTIFKKAFITLYWFIVYNIENVKCKILKNE
ncbi:MAG: hypothetical protein N2643_04415 [Endomicrobia bacterium]|nr:hypothetical protein [Endomicrobiia bacterium]